MKIALISFEYPPDTAHGGIATYAQQTSRMLRARGHHVEVFTSTPLRARTDEERGLVIHRIREASPRAFGRAIGPRFAARHDEVRFDVLEGPEYHADAAEAARLVPDIPLVLKLHTPSWLLLRLNYRERSLARSLIRWAGALVRGGRPHWGYAPEHEGYRAYVAEVDEAERGLAREADEIVSPSRSLARLAIRAWRLDPARVVTIPYTFVPPDELLAIPADTRTDRVTFLGRLEARKGVLELAHAIPRVVAAFPGVRFRFVGAPETSPSPGLDMRQYLERRLHDHAARVELTGPVPHARVPEILAETDVCVFPSRWENFPFTCLEAMAAARGIVGSGAGGMADMLAYGSAGRLVPPRRPRAIAAAILELLRDPAERMRLGAAARERVLSEYGADRVGAAREASYRRAIERRRALGARGSAR